MNNTLDRIKKVAKLRGYNLSQLNKKAGLGVGTIYHWKINQPNINHLQKVANVLNVSLDYLMDKKEEEKNINLEELLISDSICFNNETLSNKETEFIQTVIREYLISENKLKRYEQ